MFVTCSSPLRPSLSVQSLALALRHSLCRTVTTIHLQHWLSLPHWNSAPTQHKLPLPENHRATLYVIDLGAGLSHLTLNACGGHSLLVPFYRQG